MNRPSFMAISFMTTSIIINDGAMTKSVEAALGFLLIDRMAVKDQQEVGVSEETKGSRKYWRARGLRLGGRRCSTILISTFSHIKEFGKASIFVVDRNYLFGHILT